MKNQIIQTIKNKLWNIIGKNAEFDTQIEKALKEAYEAGQKDCVRLGDISSWRNYGIKRGYFKFFKK